MLVGLFIGLVWWIRWRGKSWMQYNEGINVAGIKKLEAKSVDF